MANHTEKPYIGGTFGKERPWGVVHVGVVMWKEGRITRG